MSIGAIADGYLAASNTYDGYMYVFGKGKSETTISAPQAAITSGMPVVISGSVLDQSPAQIGTPCVSKESMTEWMEYLHMQHSIPANVIGIPISIDTFDPNGNLVHVATVTSDGTSGTFAYTWTPNMSGDYKIYATFAGDASYSSSTATTYATVIDKPSSTTTTQKEIITPDSTMLLYGILVAVIIAIFIGLTALIAVFRKR
jgi:hypothetical protein